MVKANCSDSLFLPRKKTHAELWDSRKCALPPQSWKAPPTLKRVGLDSGHAQRTTKDPMGIEVRAETRKMLQKVLKTRRLWRSQRGLGNTKLLTVGNDTDQWQSGVQTALELISETPADIPVARWQEMEKEKKNCSAPDWLEGQKPLS